MIGSQFVRGSSNEFVRTMGRAYSIDSRVGMIACGLKRDDIFSLEYSFPDRGRISQPGYFSRFFRYFGFYLHTSNVFDALSARLRHRCHLPLYFPFVLSFSSFTHRPTRLFKTNNRVSNAYHFTFCTTRRYTDGVSFFSFSQRLINIGTPDFLSKRVPIYRVYTAKEKDWKNKIKTQRTKVAAV